MSVNYRQLFKDHYRIEFSKDYVVHHRDFDRGNNDICNLMVMPRRLHAKYHYCLNAMRPYYSDMHHSLIDATIGFDTTTDFFRAMLRNLADAFDDIAFWEKVYEELCGRRAEIESSLGDEVATIPLEEYIRYV